ncbi:MAG: hypothetical protein QM692_07400 [Thermomicrobiales bacterium]
MDAREFDALVSRITAMSTRRAAVAGLAGGAVATAGLIADAGAMGKRRSAVRAEGKKKKKACICASYEMLECKTKKFKKSKQANHAINDNPGSYAGACEPMRKRMPGRDR